MVMQKSQFIAAATVLLILLSITAGVLAIYGQTETWGWNKMSSPTLATLTSVSTVSESDAWAVGVEGTIIHWNGERWNNVTSPSNNYLYSVDMTSSNEGYAVSFALVTPINESIVRWDGSSWKNLTTPTSYLRSVKMLNSTYGWAVGYAGLIFRWNGNNWAQVETPTNTPLESVDVVDAAAAWAVGDNRYDAGVFHWNGTSWSVVEPAIGIRTLRSVDMLNASDVWAVGDGGTIIRWNGTGWNNVSSPIPVNMHLFSVDMLDSSDGWAVGSSGSIIRWNGTSWSNVASPTGAWLSSVNMLNATYGWIVGAEGSIFRWEQKLSIILPIVYVSMFILVFSLIVVASIIVKEKRKRLEPHTLT